MGDGVRSSTVSEREALVALLRRGRRPWHECAELVLEPGGAMLALERALGERTGQGVLLAEDPAPALARARAEIASWEAAGIELLTVLDPGYPRNLRLVHDQPPLIFVAGRLEPGDERSIAVIGSRRASSEGLQDAAAIARHLAAEGWTVVSGLALGIDAAAHRAALDVDGRTIAVIGTGLSHAYPPQHAELQALIATRCAVVSQFWPESRPSRQSFPLRNAVMSGLARASVIVEASPRSGARVQARLALAHGRPVFLTRRLLAQSWARELAARPGVHVVSEPRAITDLVERLDDRTLTG